MSEIEKGYSLVQASELLGVKRRTLYSWIRQGKMKAKKIPNTSRWIVMESEIKRMQGK